MKKVRTFGSDDKLLLAVAMLNAGIKVRIRKLRIGIRVVFDGPSENVAAVLNSEGFLNASGCEFGVHSFDGNQAFVRYVAI
jgi:hypothetical protein